MTRLLQFAVLLLLVAAVAAGSCFVTGRYVQARKADSVPSLHAAIHSRLKLTEDQEKRLDPIEARFAEQRRHYAEMIRVANGELADAIAADQADSVRVRAAVEHIHDAMGDLQKATLDHVFAMQEVLTPDQYGTLLRLTAEGLRHQQ